MAEIILNVDVRENTGTGGARAARRSGAVPGILYGGDKAPVAISVNEKDFRKNLYTGKLLGHLVTLKYGEESQSVIAKDVQFDPVSDRPLHFDLMRVDAKAPVKIEVAVHFANADEARSRVRAVRWKSCVTPSRSWSAPTRSRKNWLSTWPRPRSATPSVSRTSSCPRAQKPPSPTVTS